ncbi:MAG TPA: hypothetical protein VLB67_03180 [Acidimicrobiia bacterium]|nr:hypothetical protein [Acidimicrobiia bacterium]
MTKLIPLLLVTILTAACASADERADAIVCSTAYRVSTSESLTGTDTLRLADEDSGGSIPYVYLEFHAAYTDGRADGERALRVWVTPTGTDEVIVTHLYQLPPDTGPTDQFVGGHGFTGLNYAYDPVSGAELQYWCETE